MAQAQATPKSRRLALHVAAALAGPRAARALPLQPSEASALDLRPVRQTRRPARAVVFLIPLVAPDQVGDWTAVTERLAATLHSLVAQSDPRWQVVICCQVRPPLPDDPRITHLAFDDTTPGNDKWRKLGALTAALAATDDPVFAMSFDADDLLHRDAVATMLARPDADGHLVEQGLVMDHATGKLAVARAQSLFAPLQKAFWKLCGSCAAIRVDPQVPESTAFLSAMVAHEHRMFPYLAALAGLRLQPFARPMVLYVLNHGENFGARRGRVRFKTRFVNRFAMPKDQVPAALEGFDPPI